MSAVTDYMNAMPAYVKAQQDGTFGGIDRLQSIQQKYYDNKKLSELLPFVAPKEQAMTEQEQTKSQFAPSTAQADINSKNSLAQYQYEQAMKTRDETANLSADQWQKVFSSAPDWAKAQMLVDRQNATRANPALAGTSAPGYGQGQPTSAFAPQQQSNNGGQQQASQGYSSQFMPSDIQAARGITPEAANAGMSGGQTRQSGLIPASQVPVPSDFQTNGQSTYGNQQPNLSKDDYDAATTLYSDKGRAAQQAKLGSDLALGDAGQRTSYINASKAFNSVKDLNNLTFEDPKMLSKFAGLAGKGKYEAGKIGSMITGKSMSPEFKDMQAMIDTYSKITPEALSKAYTNAATLGSIKDMSDIMHKGFGPGANPVQTLNAMTILLNLQANDFKQSAYYGGMSDDFKEKFGVDPSHDFSKNPIVPKMTHDQALQFLKSMTPAQRDRYMPGIKIMRKQTGQAE